MTDSVARKPAREHSVPWFWPFAAAIEEAQKIFERMRGYALAWLPLTNLIAISVRRLIDLEAAHQNAHLSRTEGRLHSS